MEPSAEDKLKADTVRKVSEGIRDETAGFLKENYELLRLAFPGHKFKSAAALTNADYRQMADDAIGEGRAAHFILEDGEKQRITIDDINKKLMENSEAKKFITARGAKHLAELVPTREQITLIADQAGAVAAENSASYTNVALGAGNAVLGFLNLSSGNSREPAAANVRSDMVSRLQKLIEHNPGIKRIIGDGTNANDGISRISTRMYEAVLNPPKENETVPDPLDARKVKPIDDALRGVIGEKIHDEVYRKMQTALTERVKEEVNQARNAQGFMGFMFKIAQALGLGRFVAKLAGKPIPTDIEIQKTAASTAHSVSHVLTSKEFRYNGRMLSQLTAEETGAAIQEQVLRDLESKRAELPSFKPAQLEEIALRAGNNIKENFSSIPKLDSAPMLPPTATYSNIGTATHVPGGETVAPLPSPPGTGISQNITR